MRSFNDEMADYETITTLDDDAMIAIWQAQCDYVRELLADNRNVDDWSDSTCDWFPDAIILAASFFNEAHEGPMITLEVLRIHVAHASIDNVPWGVAGRLFDTYDDMTALRDSTYHMMTDRWEPGVITGIDTKALPTD